MSENGCGFLSSSEIDAWLERRLPAERSEALDRHVAAGCGPCALLVEDARVFEGALREAGRADREHGAEQEHCARIEPLLVAQMSRAARDSASAGTARDSASAGQGVTVTERPVTVTPRATGRWWAGAGALAATVLVCALLVPFLRQGGDAGRIPLPGGGFVSVEALAFDAPPTVRASGGTPKDWAAAGSAYRAGRWDEAAQRFGAIADAQQGDAGQDHEVAQHGAGEGDAALYAGVSELLAGAGAGRAERAFARLERARSLAEAQGLPTGAIDWYRALAALRQGDTARARAALEAARAEGGTFGARAARLLEDLGGPRP